VLRSALAKRSPFLLRNLISPIVARPLISRLPTVWEITNADWSIDATGLVATRIADATFWGILRSTNALATGRFAATCNVLAYATLFSHVGIDCGANSESDFLGRDGSDIGKSVGYASNGSLYADSSVVATLPAWGASDKVEFEKEDGVRPGSKLTIYLNGSSVWSTNEIAVDLYGQVTGTLVPLNGRVYAAVDDGNGTGTKFTADFGQFGGSVAGLAYTLACDPGTFSIVGQPASLILGYNFGASQGTYTYTGQSANLTIGYVFTASFGTYSYAGQSANLARGYNFTGTFGSFSYSGQPATLTATYGFPAASGIYNYTGQDVGLSYGRALAADAATFSYSGQDAGLLVGLGSSVDPAIFTYTGQTAGLLLGYAISPSFGVFTYTGQDASFSLGSTIFTLTADVGIFTYGGQAAALLRAFTLAIDPGVYAYTGQPAGLGFVGALPAAPAIFTYTGFAARAILNLAEFPSFSGSSGARVSAFFYRP
jgi:hypothetical protein